LQGQPKVVSVVHEGVGMHLRLWTPETGLPHWHIGGMFQDSRGYVWMQHHALLTRFDGTTFRVVDTMAIGPSTMPVAFFAEDHEGNIWCYRTSASGQELRIVRTSTLRTESFREYTGLAEAPEHLQYVYSVDGAVYMVSIRQQKVWRYDGALREVLCDPHPKASENCRIYLPGPEGYFWHTDLSRTIHLLDERGAILRRFTEGPKASGAKMYYADKHFYLYTSQPDHPGFLVPRSLLEVEAGQPGGHRASLPWGFPLWGDVRPIPDIRATLYYKEDIGKPTLYMHESGAMVDILTTASAVLGMPLKHALLYPAFPCYFMLFNGAYTPGNVLLIPVEGKGLLQVELMPRRFRTLAANISIRSLCWTAPDQLLAIGAVEEPYLLDCNVSTQQVRRIPWRSNPYSAVSEKGNIWVGSRNANMTRLDAAYRVRDDYPRPRNPAGVFQSTETRCITPIGDTALWYGAQQGLLELNRISGEHRYVLADREVCWIHRDRQGAYWVGTSGGVFHVASGKTYLDSVDRAPLRVHHIYESPDGYFWLSTPKGLVRWQPFSTEYERYNQSNGLMSDQLHAAYPDRHGRLWLSSNGGIMAFDPSDGSVMNFTTSDGLANNEHNYLAHAQAPDGKLYFGGIQGITAFDPNEFPRKVPSTLTTLRVDEVQQLNRDGLHMPPVFPDAASGMQVRLQASCIQARLQISMPNLSLSKPQYAWRIEGVSPEWTRFDLEDGITLSGVPHGSHQLDIRATNPTNLADHRVYKISLHKALYTHQKWWFRALMIALLAGLVALLLRRRTAGLEAQNLALEQKVAERTQTITDQKQALERISDARSQLFNNISHEFRTPLSIIRGHAEKLHRDLKTQPEATAALRHIEKQIALLTQMLEEVMDLSMLQMGAMGTHPEPVDWKVFVRRTFAMFEGLAHRKRQHYALEMNPQEAPFCLVDTAKMTRILSNLIGNAIKFTPEGGRIVVRSAIADGQIHLSVSDSGPGIHADEQELIFERYRQGLASKGAAQPGYGIGLALSREYAHLVGARLTVESAPGKGATFVLCLPFQAAGTPFVSTAPTGQTMLPAGKNRGRSHQGHVLVAEDNEDLLAFMREILEENYQVTTVFNGDQAWECLLSDPSIDLVVSDAMMPTLDGFGLLERTRQHPQLGFIPFVMITALAGEPDRVRALRLGVDAFMTKPFTISALKTQIDNCIKQQVARKAYAIETRAMAGQEPLNHPERPKSYEETWLINLQTSVQQHLHNPNYKIADMAQGMHMTERTLYNWVTAYTGLSPSAYLRKARLYQAMYYAVCRTFKTNKQLAAAVGMTDARYFANAFKKAFGMPPEGVQAFSNVGDSADPEPTSV